MTASSASRVLADLDGALVADPVERRLDRGDPVGDELDDDPPAVGGVGDTPDIAGLLEPVDDARDGARGEAHELGQATGGGGAGVDEDFEGLDVGLGQAEADGDGLAEERALEIHPAQGPEDGVDASRSMVDNLS